MSRTSLIMAVLLTEFSGQQPATITFNLGEKKGVGLVEFAPVGAGSLPLRTPVSRQECTGIQSCPPGQRRWITRAAEPRLQTAVGRVPPEALAIGGGPATPHRTECGDVT